MELHQLTQGTPQWHAHRLSHFNASDAPAMMGCSAYKTRSQLLHEMHTGIVPEVDAATQRRFDDGHRFEALARPLAEEIIGDDLYPVVGSLQKLSASFDGLTMDRATDFEHKSLNAELREAMHPDLPIDAIPLQYRVQMEQQLLVSGAKQCLFMATKWQGDELVEERHAWYHPDPELRQQIIAGWEQFEKDLATYTPEVIEAAPVGKSPETLPALHIEVTGMVTASNLAEYKARALAVFASVNRELVTDQDFADAKKAIKWAGDIETRLQGAKQHALSQTESIDALFRAIDDISEEARRVRLDLNNMVKSRETTLKAEIVADGRNALADHVAACNKRIGRPFMPVIPADFAAAIKGMSKFENMRNAVATELARAKISANEWADKITMNLKAITEQADHGFLFSDVPQLVLKDAELVAMAIKSRIADHQAKEAARIAAETARIAEQERIKAEATAQARANAEIAAATAQARDVAQRQAAADAEAKRASDEAIARAAAPEIVETATIPIDSFAAFLKKEPDDAKESVQTMRLGQISEKLGFVVTAEFLSELGFKPCATDKNAKLYKARLFPLICQELVKHIQYVCELQES